MKLIKGIIIGSALTAAAYMMYTEGMVDKKKMAKQAKRWAHKIGINY